jgi:hypothetical protein
LRRIVVGRRPQPLGAADPEFTQKLRDGRRALRPLQREPVSDCLPLTHGQMRERRGRKPRASGIVRRIRIEWMPARQ